MENTEYIEARKNQDLIESITKKLNCQKAELPQRIDLLIWKIKALQKKIDDTPPRER